MCTTELGRLLVSVLFPRPTCVRASRRAQCRPYNIRFFVPLSPVRAVPGERRAIRRLDRGRPNLDILCFSRSNILYGNKSITYSIDVFFQWRDWIWMLCDLGTLSLFFLGYWVPGYVLSFYSITRESEHSEYGANSRKKEVNCRGA